MIVTGIGQCSWDYLAVVDSFPQVNTKKEVHQWDEQGGGPVATALVTLSRLGIKCRFHGVTGDDHEGKEIRQSLIDENINTTGILIRASASSQIAFIVIEKNTGKRTIFWKRPAGAELKIKELGSNFLKNSRFLLIDGLMKDISLYAAKKAQSLKIPVMLDAGKMRGGMLEIAKNCDYVVASEEFGKALGWKNNPKAFLKKIKHLKFKIFTATLGEKGSYTFFQDKYFYTPAFKVKAVDTTGAGDVFHGGYVFGILKGWEIEYTVRFASAIAAMKCRKIGGRAGIVNLNEVLRFMGGK
jgi:ribokinase